MQTTQEMVKPRDMINSHAYPSYLNEIITEGASSVENCNSPGIRITLPNIAK